MNSNRAASTSSSRSSMNDIDKAMILKLMKIFLALVFAGWIFAWTIKPTNTFRNTWSPKLYADTNSTYFGRLGTTILIYAFPVMFVAVLGCIYLHLHEKNDDKKNQGRNRFSSSLAAWKRPVLVRGPLGVVSGIELTFSLMFLALLVWCFTTYLKVSFANLKVHHSEKVWQAKLDSTALRLGLIGNLCCAFLFFPVTRCSSLLPLVGLTSESSIKYHIWLGHIVMVLFTAHGVCYFIFWASTNQLDEMIKWSKTDIANVPGELALLSGLALWATTFPRIRRNMFELFYYTHHLYIAFFFFYMLHVGIGFICQILPGIFLFMVDRYLRFLQSRTKVHLVSVRLLPSEGIELNFSKNPGFSYNPLSTIFINVPSVSRLQWHPFTISSSSNLEPERLSVIMKKEGSWTQKLYRTLSEHATLDGLDVSVEGPYSPISENFLRYESLVMISGGSGITPFISIIREFIHRSNSLNIPTPNLLLICAFKNSMDLTMLDLLLPVSGNVSDLSHLNLKIEAYVTREKEALISDEQTMIRTICFKPKPSHMPISPVLGPNSWLCLAIIISTSFVAFLILIGILQRFYIYPIDKNTGDIYSLSSMTVLYLLVMCTCIAVACSVLFLKNKRENMKGAKQINSLDLPTPMTSPSSWYHCTGKEVESLPQESLVKATNVHYGRRPDLKMILLAIDDENVGVMASGPTGLRHQTAAICSSGLADNLHYESISFNW
ncbi:ferric reduction oxidase 2-like [Carex rostrata]